MLGDVLLDTAIKEFIFHIRHMIFVNSTSFHRFKLEQVNPLTDKTLMIVYIFHLQHSNLSFYLRKGSANHLNQFCKGIFLKELIIICLVEIVGFSASWGKSIGLLGDIIGHWARGHGIEV